MPSNSHFGNWLDSIIGNRQPIAPIQQSVRSLEACCAAWISMKLRSKVSWDASKETFIDNTAANALCSRKARNPKYDWEVQMKKFFHNRIL